MRIKELVLFMQKRHAIYRARAVGKPWPWTDDPILRTYRFCNIYRNLDKQTRLIHNNWLAPNGRSEDVWFACVVARLVNWWPTLEELGYPLPWGPEHFVSVLRSRKERGEKVFTGAYMIRADAVIQGGKAEYLAACVLHPMWQARFHIRPRPGDTLATFHERLTRYRDMGSFMAAQVVADAKYFDLQLLLAKDWHTWAAPGPGSLRGLNRVRGLPPDTPWGPGEWEGAFAGLYKKSRRAIVAARLPSLDGQDLQNCLCEWDKYERVRLGQGRPRSKYHPENQL